MLIPFPEGPNLYVWLKKKEIIHRTGQDSCVPGIVSVLLVVTQFLLPT